MQFKDYLATFPTIEHLAGLEVKNSMGEVIHTIPAIEAEVGLIKTLPRTFCKI